MIVVRYAVCSERAQKPLTRSVVDTRAEAERLIERYRREDGHDIETAYWIAELGPECEAWRWLARKRDKPEKGNKRARVDARASAESTVDEAPSSSTGAAEGGEASQE